jgi:hypothetical protein
LFSLELIAEGERIMTGTTTPPTRSSGQDTRRMISTDKTRTPRPAHAEQSRPTTKTQAKREADRWLAEMMFDHYNG